MKTIQIICFIVAVLLFNLPSAFSQTYLLHTNWQFKNRQKTIWYPATVPGTIHTDLLANHLIADPFYGDNENKLQWIGQTEWEYQTRFDIPYSTNSEIFLQFDGLDTYTSIYLNHKLLLKTDNMFRTYKVPVSKLLKQKGNDLRIVFYSAERQANLAAKRNGIIYPCENNRNFA
ncbi:MAG: hypothetical protein IPJ31_05855 [Bacteroidetes bacterium]|nr:hypothetical protein [Bacteroidota bacterium]